MFQPQPTPYAAFAYGLGPEIPPHFAFHSSPLGGIPDGGGQQGAPPHQHQHHISPPPRHNNNTQGQASTFIYPASSRPTASSTSTSSATTSTYQSLCCQAPAPAQTSALAPAPAPTSVQHSACVPPGVTSVSGVAPPTPRPPPLTTSVVPHGSSTITAAPTSSPLPPRPSQLSRLQQRRAHPHSRTHMRQHHHPQRQHAPHYALRSQVKMEGNLQQLSDIAAQEAAARDYKAQHQGPLVGEKTPSQAIADEYAKADPVYVEKTIALHQTYSHYRPIRGDGNCGWRAIAFGYFEFLVDTGDRSLLEAELARLTSLNNFLVRNGYDLTLLEDMVQETLDLLRDLASSISNPSAAMGILMNRFSDESTDNAIIYHMRILAAACLKSDPRPYEHFILAEGGVHEYVQTTIEVPGREIEQIGIHLLAKMLLEPAGLALEIAYLDRTPGSEVNTYTFPDSAESQASAILCLLFRPDHYDIVYRGRQPPPPAVTQPAPSPETSLQINRADSFTHGLQISHNPAAMSGFSPMDISGPLTTLLSGMAGSQALSPLAAIPQTSPLSDTYSPTSQSIWPMVSTFADAMTPALQRPLSPAPAQPQPMMEADLDRQVRFSKYNYPELVDDQGYPEPTFQTTAFKNSQYNKAHYNNPNFQPEEYNPNDDSGERINHRKKGP